MNKAKFIHPLPSRAWIEKELDEVCRQITRQIGVCARCGARKGLEDAHIIGRQNHAVRWDLDNRLPLCGLCHRWAHDNPILFDEFARNTLGELKYEALRQRAMAIRIWAKSEMLSYLNVLRRQVGLVFSKEKTVEV